MKMTKCNMNNNLWEKIQNCLRLMIKKKEPDVYFLENNYPDLSQYFPTSTWIINMKEYIIFFLNKYQHQIEQ